MNDASKNKNLQFKPAVDDRFKVLTSYEMSQDLYVSDIQEGEKKTERRDSLHRTKPNYDTKNVTKLSTADLISVNQSNQQVAVPQKQPVIPLPISKINKEEEKAEATYSKTDTFLEHIK